MAHTIHARAQNRCSDPNCRRCHSSFSLRNRRSLRDMIILMNAYRNIQRARALSEPRTRIIIRYSTKSKARVKQKSGPGDALK